MLLTAISFQNTLGNQIEHWLSGVQRDRPALRAKSQPPRQGRMWVPVPRKMQTEPLVAYGKSTSVMDILTDKGLSVVGSEAVVSEVVPNHRYCD